MSNTADLNYFDNIGELFDVYMNEYDVERRLHLVFSVLLKYTVIKNNQVLEVGSGTGRFSQRIVELGGQLTIVDIGKNLVEAVRSRLGCRGVAADACQLPFEDNSFDLVISSECIEHTLTPCKAIREMCRVCKPGGTVCLTTPNKLWYPALWLSQVLKIRKFAGMENWIFPGTALSEMVCGGMNQFMVRGCHLWPFQLRFTQPLLRRLDSYSRRLYPMMINFGIVGQKKTGLNICP
ncbi:MAG: class I SAM-dependent methyltransferase [Planctomycetes bacterium]|nr:class I SAM-dependent methyltransferase [Planctomycetota bacterium]